MRAAQRAQHYGPHPKSLSLRERDFNYNVWTRISFPGNGFTPARLPLPTGRGISGRAPLLSDSPLPSGEGPGVRAGRARALTLNPFPLSRGSPSLRERGFNFRVQTAVILLRNARLHFRMSSCPKKGHFEVCGWATSHPWKNMNLFQSPPLPEKGSRD